MVALTGAEWAVLVVAIAPAVAAVVVVWLVWRWGKRTDAEEEAAAPERDGGEPGSGPGEGG